MESFTFLYYLFEIQGGFYTYKHFSIKSRFQVLISHIWLVACVLDSAVLSL